VPQFCCRPDVLKTSVLLAWVQEAGKAVWDGEWGMGNAPADSPGHDFLSPRVWSLRCEILMTGVSENKRQSGVGLL